ncbi:proteasome subunit alpha type 6 [Colletotrichum truncatum]|uniref:Proteasome subunit alpha type 6 n=1 Tax=Colletotrichum truncatum TaxID=5467 RepID=A0ACC3ZF12_COLTU|nr:proteasome subunit alpha type 6 [Colletotrichum truncatum]KAF6801569.1 proteasome subunit alpha type 6 [Colletotrichum truncatum]
MSANIPAWKRLGLKLKQPASGSETGGPATTEGSRPNGQRYHNDRDANGPVNAASAAAAKRKRPENTSTPPAFSSPLKRTRTDGHAATPPTLRKQKSVTFADDTKNPAAAEPTKTGDAASAKKKSKKAAKPATQQQQADIRPSLDYLRNWKSSRETWKFNKNYQTILMKRVFQPDSIPSSDINTFYDYIQDLKGFTRTRLRETAAEVKQEDAAKGKAGFPEGTPDMDTKQSEYEKVLAGLMQLGSGGSGKRKRFDESGFVSQSTDVAITQRVIKRMRAETILEELSESEDSDAMTIDTEETPSTSQAAAQEETVDKRVKLNDGTKQNAPRRRKQRTANMDDTSSDESSDSDSDSSSDSDDSDDSDNESEIQRQAAQRDAETSSSSSSSSEEEDSDDSSDDDSSEEEGNTKKSAGKKR